MSTYRTEPSEFYVGWFVAVTGLVCAGVFLTSMILLGLSTERTAIRQIQSTWHETMATSFGPPILISPSQTTTQATYTLDGKTYTATVPWNCFSKSTPPSGTRVQVYASTQGTVYCSQDGSGVPRAAIPKWLIPVDIFGTMGVAVLAGFLGFALALMSWSVGWWLGSRIGPEKA